MPSIFRSYARNEQGSAAVEFGLIAIGFITLLLGIIESGRLFLTWNTFQFAIENASRIALVDADITEEELQAFVGENLQDFLVSDEGIEVDVQFPVVNGVNFVEVTGTYPYDVIVPFLPESWSELALNASSRLPRPD